jgi:hypothetical protein
MSTGSDDDSTDRQVADATLDRSFRRNGAVIMSLFALIWAISVPGFSSTTLQWTVLGAALTVTVTTVVLALRGQPVQRSRSQPSDWQRRYNLVGLMEGVAIGLIIAALIYLGQPAFIPAPISVIVGLHFFPLAHAFDQPQYVWTGVGLCVIGGIGVALFAMLSDQAGRALVGIGAAATLWVTSADVTVRG